MKIMLNLLHFDYIIRQFDHIRVSLTPSNHNRYASCPVADCVKKIAE